MMTSKTVGEVKARVPFDGRRALWSPSFFRGEWRRSWPKTLFYEFAFFFVLPLPLLFLVNSRRSWDDRLMSERLWEMLFENLWLYGLAACAAGVFAGMLATRYLCHRASVDYYHSLPMRREGLLLHNWLAGVVWFVPALLCNLIVSVFVILSRFSAAGYAVMPLQTLLTTVGQMLLIFLFFYTLTVFCGMLCGTSTMQVMLVGLVLGILPLFTFLLVSFCDRHAARISFYSTMEPYWQWTSPLMRLFYLSEEDARLQPWEIGAAVIGVAVLFFGAMLIYRRRRVERAGVPVVFDGVAKMVKWTVMIPSTMALGWLFCDLGRDGLIWLLFGLAMGGFLSFLLINTILTKNPKRMFEGWRGMLIYVVACCVGYFGFAFGVTAIDDAVPSHVKQVSISFYGENYGVEAYTDPAVIAAWQALWASASEEDGEYAEVIDTKAYEESSAESTQVRTYVFEPNRIQLKTAVKVGPIRVQYLQRQFVREDAEALLRAVADSAEFEENYRLILAEASDAVFEESDIFEHVQNVKYASLEIEYLAEQVCKEELGMTEEVLCSKNGAEVWRMPREEIPQAILAEAGRDISFESFQQPVYASMLVQGWGEEIWGELPISAFPLKICMSMPSLYEALLGMNEEEMYGAMADVILSRWGYLLVARRDAVRFTAEDEGVLKVTDRGQIVELLRGMSCLTSYAIYGNDISCFTVLDEGYGVVFPADGYDHAVYFIKGKVPAFVTAALGG